MNGPMNDVEQVSVCADPTLVIKEEPTSHSIRDGRNDGKAPSQDVVPDELLLAYKDSHYDERVEVNAFTQHPEVIGSERILSQHSQNLTAHRVAGNYGMVIGHSERHYSKDGVQDEGEKHVLVEGDSLAAKTLEAGEDDQRDDQGDNRQTMTHHG